MTPSLLNADWNDGPESFTAEAVWVSCAELEIIGAEAASRVGRDTIVAAAVARAAR